jgi:nitrite reductase (NADH) large subunit
MRTRPKLVVVGNGMAGIACLEQLLRLAPDRYDVTVFGDEDYPNYNRILLSSVLAGEASWDDITLNGDAWYQENRINLFKGVRVAAIDRAKRVAVADSGLTAPYDELILATGSRALVPPIPGTEKEGVIAFRTIEDCKAMMRAAKSVQRAAVIGGGLLGLEAARGLQSLGMEVVVVHLVDRLMERQLDAAGAGYVERAMRALGITVLLGKETIEIMGDGRVAGLRFADGGVLDADLVVMAAGIRPNADLARAAGIPVRRGIVVDDLLRTLDERISAVGECAEHRGVCYGLVAPLYEQGRALAARLAGKSTTPYEGSVVSTKLKVSGVNVFSAGESLDDKVGEVVRFEHATRGTYKKLVARDDRLVGAILVGDTSEAELLDRLVHEHALLASALSSEAAEPGAPCAVDVASLADDAVVCGCNGVAKGTIVCAIREQNLLTRKEVTHATNASRSCGGCGEQVERLIQLVHAGAAVPQKPKKKPLCECTELAREDVVSKIREQHLTSVRGAMRTLGWKTEGCSTCRPAINYYLTMCWPGENEDDPASRHVNERVHANIQKDGTFSVVPRIYGGVVTPDELMRIAEVARKYAVPTVKITGGQRIDLLGVSKEDLPHIWKDLDLPSGFAYGKAVRTVKTCVGSTWCRYGTRDAMNMGIRIERTFENLWTPAKVKMAVNGCPRNCAESLIKDVGLIAVDTAWQIHVGGNGGVHVRKAELLATVETDDDAVEIVGAFLQHYREEAAYGERTSVWCERVGIATLVERIADDRERRRALFERVSKALAHRVDPWKDTVQKLGAHEAGAVREFTHVSLPMYTRSAAE